jgi:hypothetical protein
VISSILVANQSSILRLKFDFTPKVSSLVNDAFTLWTTVGPSVELASPFRTIDTYNDYNDISRTLTLFVNTALDPNTTYELRVNGLLDVANVPQGTGEFEFETEESVDPIVEPTPDVVNVIDRSVTVSTLLDPELVIVGGEGLSVDDTDPANGEYYATTDYNHGRIILKFSQAIDPNYLVSPYIKVQQKIVQRAPARWTTVAAQISQSTTEPWVYVDFPSQDATPVYYPEQSTYFVENYKYRILVSKGLSS